MALLLLLQNVLLLYDVFLYLDEFASPSLWSAFYLPCWFIATTALLNGEAESEPLRVVQTSAISLVWVVHMIGAIIPSEETTETRIFYLVTALAVWGLLCLRVRHRSPSTPTTQRADEAALLVVPAAAVLVVMMTQLDISI